MQLQYFRPDDLDTAIDWLSSNGASVAAGCTDLLAGTTAQQLPGPVLDLTGISSLRGIAESAEGWRFGATTTWSDVIATVKVRNDSSHVWTSDRVLAVFLSYKLFHRTAQGVRVAEGGRTPLPASIAPGEVLEAEIEIGWPAAPRNYGLSIDLVHEGIAWFEEHNGSPLARSEVRVVSLPEAEPAPALEPSEEAEDG